MTFASRSWKAFEITDPVGSKYVLTVTGEVEVLRTNQVPKLTRAVPQGFNPKILLLDLTVEDEGDFGGDIVEWKSVEFVEEISAEEYGEVTILGETDAQTVPVEIIPS